jgi:hypothetical protein
VLGAKIERRKYGKLVKRAASLLRQPHL